VTRCFGRHKAPRKR